MIPEKCRYIDVFLDKSKERSILKMKKISGGGGSSKYLT